MTSTGSVMRNTNRTGNRLRRFVFTLNNYTEQEYQALVDFSKDVTWFIMGRETGENGTPHLQGACVLGRQIGFSTLKAYAGFTRCHIESMKGDPQANRDYCSKQDLNFYEIGALPQPGKRTDLHEVCDAMREGNTLRQIAETHPVQIVKYSKGLLYYRSLLAKPRDVNSPPKIFWIHGPTGCGKSRFVYELAMAIAKGVDNIWSTSSDLKWFDGYDGQKVAIFDDFRPKEVSFSFLLRVLDRYPLQVPIKGSYTNWNPEYIFITAPHDPCKLFEYRATYRAEDIQQLNRRISKVFDFGLRDHQADAYREFIDYIPTPEHLLPHDDPIVVQDVRSLEDELTEPTESLESDSESSAVFLEPGTYKSPLSPTFSELADDSQDLSRSCIFQRKPTRRQLFK